MQGGTAVSTYLLARSLLKEGQLTGVVTSATREPPWTRGRASSHPAWSLDTRVVDVSESPGLVHIPQDRPLLSQLIGAVLQEAELSRPDVILGWYFEPFGMAAAIAGQSRNLPVVLVHAGSDIGRLTGDPYLRSSYTMALARAHVLATPAGEAVLKSMGVERVAVMEAQRAAPWHFLDSNDEDSAVDFSDAELRTWSAALPHEARRWIEPRLNVPERCAECTHTFLLLGKSSPMKSIRAAVVSPVQVHERFRTSIHLNLVTGGTTAYMHALAGALRQTSWEHVGIAPFVAPWSVPTLYRRHDGVLVLENNHDVAFHASRMPLEVLLSGTPLLISRELRDALPWGDSLIHGRTCFIVERPRHPASVAEALHECARDAHRSEAVGKRGRALARSLERLLPSGNSAHRSLNSLSI